MEIGSKSSSLLVLKLLSSILVLQLAFTMLSLNTLAVLECGLVPWVVASVMDGSCSARTDDFSLLGDSRSFLVSSSRILEWVIAAGTSLSELSATTLCSILLFFFLGECFSFSLLMLSTGLVALLGSGCTVWRDRNTLLGKTVAAAEVEGGRPSSGGVSGTQVMCVETAFLSLSFCLCLNFFSCDSDSLKAGGNSPSLVVVLAIPPSSSVLLGRNVRSLSDRSDCISPSPPCTLLSLVAFRDFFGEETFDTTTEKPFKAFRRL